MSVYKLFNVVGSSEKLLFFIEYLEILGYKNLYKNKFPFYGIIRVDVKNKKYHNQYVLLSYKTFDVEKDAEKIDELITGPNKNPTEARDEFFKSVEEVENDIRLKNIEVNGPEELPQDVKEINGDIFTRTDGSSEWVKSNTGGLVFENNITLGKAEKTRCQNCGSIRNEVCLRNNCKNRENILVPGFGFNPPKRGRIIKYDKNNKKGVKHNQGKLPIDTVLTKQFPKAVEALVRCSVYGHEKYNKNGEDEDWLNFKRVEGGSQTYADAAARHNQNKSEKDEESGLPHIFHKVWNVMAEVELWIEENHKE